MKYAVSYVSGCAGDFVVNCCNHRWNLGIKAGGSTVSSASIKKHDSVLGESGWLTLLNSFPELYVGTHAVDRLLTLPVIPVWIVVPDINTYRIWARRDCATRGYTNLLSPSGDFFQKIKKLVLANNSIQAAECYLDWITTYNWLLMQMRLVQPANKIDISELLTSHGIDSIMDQLPQLKLVKQQCQQYHATWLASQVDLSESSVVSMLSIKLSKFINENSKT